jgi:type IV secretion system protein TrbE
MFKEYNNREMAVSDLLNYAHLIKDGVIINKDGAYLTSYQFRGPDINSATTAELDALTQYFNRMLLMLEDGWMIHLDEIRIPSLTYPAAGHFPNRVAELIDAEQRAFYQQEGGHFENLQFLTFVWKFPKPLVKTTRHWFVEGLTPRAGSENLTTLLNLFEETIERCIALLSSQLQLQRLCSNDLLSFLHTCISGELIAITSPPEGCYLDMILGRHDMIGGYLPKIGNKHIYTLSLIGYHNQETIPGFLEEMTTFPFLYRWSNRFVPLSEATAELEIKRIERNWNNKVKGLFGLIRETLTGKPSTHLNYDALSMSQEAQQASTVNSSLTRRFGYWTSNLILMHENLDELNQAYKDLSQYLEQRGFSCQLETINAMEAWRGSIPGHGSCNLRRLMIDSVNLAHALPLHSIWVGAAFSSPASLLPTQSPPTFYAATTGKTPFRFHTDVGDVGHILGVGPTGAGKTFFLQFLVAQFQRHLNSQIFIFDKDYSHYAFTAALDGLHYDLSDAKTIAFCPLGDLSSESKKIRAEQFLENLIFLQNVAITPQIRHDIHTTIEALAQNPEQRNRSLTIFYSMIQNETVRRAIKYYTLAGTMKILDANQDQLKKGHLQCFEMGWLLTQKSEIYIPLLMYIFDQIESRLEEDKGKRPTLIILEEAWLYIGHSIFSNKLRDWLKTMRKKNARVVFMTQSLADLYNPETKNLTQLTAAIMESCATKIYLANPKMEMETRNLYKKMGLNDRQLEIIEHLAIPKHHYYIVTPQGNRLINLGFNQTSSITLNFLGLSLQKGEELIACKQRYAEKWIDYWLNPQGFAR